MARPSKKEERTEEILEAYENAIALYGVEGATQQKIAEEAGIARPLLRHYIGNNADLLNQAVERYMGRSKRAMDDMFKYYSNKSSASHFVEMLFNDQTSERHNSDVMIAAALIYAAQTNKQLKKKMLSWFSEFKTDFNRQLKHFYPNANPMTLSVVSAGIIGIYFNVDSLVPLGNDPTFRADSCNAALHLLTLLDT